MPYQTHFYTLQALTNLHAGSGDITFGVIDKLVQRDGLTTFPTIHESGLKGSLREFCAYQLATQKQFTSDDKESKSKKANREPEMKTIFGDSEEGSGNYRFLGGQLILFPARVSAKEPFLYATCPMLLTSLLELAAHLAVSLPDKAILEKLAKLNPEKNQPLVFSPAYVGLTVEHPGIKTVAYAEALTLPDWLGGGKLLLMNLDDLTQIAGPDQLPVMARNNLEDGRSTNLWYEEFVPRQSLFSVFMLQTDTDKTADDFFANCLKHPLQVGANATIGYGLMKLTKRA